MKESTKQSTHKAFNELFMPDTQEQMADEPEEAVFVKKDEMELTKEISKGAVKHEQRPSKKVKKEMTTAAKSIVLRSEKIRMFEAVLRGA